MAASAAHETRALLRALPAAAFGCRHLSPPHRPPRRRLLRPATEPVTARRTGFPPRSRRLRSRAPGRPPGAEDESPRGDDQWRGFPLPGGGRLVFGTRRTV
ncbi:DUF6274 family protein [Streptomyces gelaticus]